MSSTKWSNAKYKLTYCLVTSNILVNKYILIIHFEEFLISQLAKYFKIIMS